VLFLEDQPHIFDVIRVRVSSIVQPLSPVYLHVGGEVEFRVESTETSSKGASSQASGIRWSSTDSSSLSIDQSSGRAQGLSEGKTEVMLSNHASAASLVHVSKVGYAQLDQQSSLILNTDSASGYSSTGAEQRVRVRFFLEG